MRFSTIIKNFYNWLTHPISPVPVGLYRFFLGILCLINSYYLWPDLQMWFSSTGVLPSTLNNSLQGLDRLNLFYFFGSELSTVRIVFFVHVIASLFLMMGLGSRIASTCVFLTLTTLHHRNVYILNGGDTLLRMMSFFIMFVDCGRAFSLDRLLRIFFGKENPGDSKFIYPTAVRVMQFQVCCVYFSTFYWKATGSHWLDGSAIYMVNQLDQFSRFWVPSLFKTVVFSKFMTAFTLTLEGSFAFLVWFKDTRKWVLLFAFLLHLGLEYSLNIQLFQFAMVTTFVLFLTRDDLKKIQMVVSRFILAQFPQLKIFCFYDGTCGFCKQTVKVLVALDILLCIRWIDGKNPEKTKIFLGFDSTRMTSEFLTLTHDQWFGGFPAMRTVALRLPLLAVFGWIGYFPGMHIIGEICYQYIAGRRHKISQLLFSNITCELPQKNS